jgi:hypothetical protein
LHDLPGAACARAFSLLYSNFALFCMTCLAQRARELLVCFIFHDTVLVVVD